MSGSIACAVSAINWTNVRCAECGMPISDGDLCAVRSGAIRCKDCDDKEMRTRRVIADIVSAVARLDESNARRAFDRIVNETTCPFASVIGQFVGMHVRNAVHDCYDCYGDESREQWEDVK